VRSPTSDRPRPATSAGVPSWSKAAEAAAAERGGSGGALLVPGAHVSAGRLARQWNKGSLEDAAAGIAAATAARKGKVRESLAAPVASVATEATTAGRWTAAALTQADRDVGGAGAVEVVDDELLAPRAATQSSALGAGPAALSRPPVSPVGHGSEAAAWAGGSAVVAQSELHAFAGTSTLEVVLRPVTSGGRMGRSGGGGSSGRRRRRGTASSLNKLTLGGGAAGVAELSEDEDEAKALLPGAGALVAEAARLRPGEASTRSRALLRAPAGLLGANESFARRRGETAGGGGDVWHPDVVTAAFALPTTLPPQSSVAQAVSRRPATADGGPRPTSVRVTLNPPARRGNHVAFELGNKPGAGRGRDGTAGHASRALPDARGAAAGAAAASGGEAGPAAVASPPVRASSARTSGRIAAAYAPALALEAGDEALGPLERLKRQLRRAKTARAEVGGGSGGAGGGTGGGGGGTSGLIPPEKVWMWPHVAGSVIGDRAGLAPFRVPAATKGHDGVVGPLVAGLADDVAARGHLASAPVGDGPVAFFLFARRQPAQPFSPAPLPAPPPPSKRSDVFQRALPKARPSRPRSGAEDDDPPQAVGRWALVAGSGDGCFPLAGASRMPALAAPLMPVGAAPPWRDRLGAVWPGWDAPAEAFGRPPLVDVRVGERIVRGGVPPQPLGLFFRAPLPRPPPPKPKPPPPTEKAKPGPPWNYRVDSIFVPRGTRPKNKDLIIERLSLTDAKKMHDNEDSQLRGFQVQRGSTN